MIGEEELSLTQVLVEFDRAVERAQTDLRDARQAAEDEFLAIAEEANAQLEVAVEELDRAAAAYNLTALSYDAAQVEYRQTKKEASQAYRQAEKDAIAEYDEKIEAARLIYRAALGSS